MQLLEVAVTIFLAFLTLFVGMATIAYTKEIYKRIEQMEDKD